MRITILCENTVGRLVGLGGIVFSALCTGMRAAFKLHQEFGDRFFYGHVGSGLEI